MNSTMRTGTAPASPASATPPSPAHSETPWGLRAWRFVKEPVEYGLFLALHGVARIVPFRGATIAGALLGEAVFRFTRIRKEVTLENLRHAFPEKGEDELRRIALGAYRNYGTAITQMLWAGGATEEELRACVHIADPGPFQRAFERGKGVLLLSGHFGTWEFLVNAFRLQIGHPFLIIVQNQRNRRINAFLDRIRTRFGNETVEMGHAVRATLRALAEGRVIGLLGDQSGSKESLFVDFFGRPAATHRGPAAFSLKSNAPIVMTYLLRRPDGGLDAVCEEVDRQGLEGATEENVKELTRRHVLLLERMIRAHPDHWLWMHKRWKHTPVAQAQKVARP
jgi:Kdo2-lipid IVA lauroyltransferase/acyltransferase